MATKEAAITGINFLPADGRTKATTLAEGDEVVLERRRGNKYDINAVAVMVGGVQIGWVARQANPPVAAAMDAQRPVKAACTRAAEMRGGRMHKEPMLRITWED